MGGQEKCKKKNVKVYVYISFGTSLSTATGPG